MTPKSQSKLHKFRDFSQNFAKNIQFQLRFSQRRKNIFDFSGRFSESSNDCLSPAFQSFFFNLIAFGREIALKQ
jgi:hypothetical protein